MMTRIALVVGMVSALAGGFGCSDKSDEPGSDATSGAEKAAKDTGDAIDEAAEDTGDKVEEATGN